MKTSGRILAAALLLAASTSMAFGAPSGGKGGGGGKGKRTTSACQTTQVAPTISGAPSTGTIEGIAYSFTPSASDANCDALTFAIDGKPAWATFDSRSGRLAGTPPAGTAGLYPYIVISVSDGYRAALLPAFSISVTPNSVPSISGTPGTRVESGRSYSFTPSASDRDGQRLSFSISNKPSWATFSTSTGQLSGTPASSNVGTTSNVAISVSDGLSVATLAPFSIEVLAVNNAPTISGTPPTSARVGSGYSFRPTASDPDGQALTFSIANPPAWASFNDATGQLAGTPPVGSSGTYSNIVISVSDGQLKASLPAFSVTVQEPVTGTATLSWQPPTSRTDGSTLTNLAGYRIHYGTSPGSYTQRITIGNAGITSAVIEGLAPGTWYFAATAYDTAGVESDYSNVGSKTIN
ncbi:MAG: putative Ig domain-containing protein [Steroidobacteraceae bacterium]|jgi:hypothetical protein|nr:putative Ig domain-containing protein [Steroidobacteraceae bacterium]